VRKKPGSKSRPKASAIYDFGPHPKAGCFGGDKESRLFSTASNIGTASNSLLKKLVAQFGPNIPLPNRRHDNAKHKLTMPAVHFIERAARDNFQMQQEKSIRSAP